MEATLTSLLRADAVPMNTLHQRYGSLLLLVQKLIGVVPNCDPYLEIWPPGFRSYNVMVPNLLNLPVSLWGMGAPIDVVGLAMYVASRTAGCAYCSAHTCSFALRRGAPPERVAQAFNGGGAGGRTPGEAAAMAVAGALASVPSALSDGQRQELLRHYSAADVEWIVLGVVMIGFLNKFMDAVGVELEGATLGEVDGLIGASGWSPGKHLDAAAAPAHRGPPRADTLGTRLSVIRFAPAALSLDRKWTAGVPSRAPAVSDYLRRHTGHDFPVLARLRHGRAVRALATMVRDNLDPATTVVGLATKCMAGSIYAKVVADDALALEMEALGRHQGLSPERLAEVARFAVDQASSPGFVDDPRIAAALLLARAASPSPAHVPATVVEACRASGLSAAAIVELVVFLSMAQMLHRLSTFYPAAQ